MLYTILQIIAFQALFLLVYDLFLKRETFFNHNRAYLLITSLLSLILPFLKFPELKTMATEDVVIHLPEVFIGIKTPSAYDIQIAEQAGIILEQPQTPIWQSITLIGIALATFIFLFKIIKLYGLKHRNPKRWQGNVLVVKLIKSSAAFSFFNTIFMGERIPEAQKPIIYKHELVHIKELHTLDLLFFEILRIIFWFNPLVYIYQNRIKELHEYIADAKAVKQSGKADYYQSLLNQVFDVNNVSFTNTFFKTSLIKKRISMLQKSKSKELNLLKYALLIPMVFGMLIYTSTEVRAQEKINYQNVEDNQELTDEELFQIYFNNILKMKEEGATYFEISEYTGLKKEQLDKYIMSREDYLKFQAHFEYLAILTIERESKKGQLTKDDNNTIALLRSPKDQSYKEYLELKKAKEAKERWELNTQNGVLKLFVEDISNFTQKEQERCDGLVKQLGSDDYFDKLVITDGIATTIVTGFDDSSSDDKTLVEVPFAVVDESPTTFECKNLESNTERKNCMNSFVNKHLVKNFNTSLADSLSQGRKRIFVQFKIDTLGYVTDIKARGPSEALELEAKRVVSTLPQFVPGRQKGELVTVPFSIPIVFQVKGDVLDPIDTINDSLAKKNYHTFMKQLEAENQKPKKFDRIPFSVVEVAPVHPDCKLITSDLEQRKCANDKVASLVNKNFNTNLAKSLDLPSGKKRIFVQYVIGKQGDVKNIVARGPHPKLEEEAIRVLKLLPQFTPGEKDGEVVDVSFSIPIVFQISQSKKN
jgi:bla regulator protein BlaR1